MPLGQAGWGLDLYPTGQVGANLAANDGEIPASEELAVITRQGIDVRKIKRSGSAHSRS